MFAAMVFDRDQFQWQQLPEMVVTWVQDAGGYALLCAAPGLVIGLLWLIFGASSLFGAARSRFPFWQSVIFLVCTGLGTICVAAAIAFPSPAAKQPAPGTSQPPPPPVTKAARARAALLTAGGAFGLIAVGVPFVAGVARIRWRRIYAVAKLSFKEGVRRRILYVFAALLLVFMFGSWFIPHKPEDQVRTYVQVLDKAMAPLLLTAGLFIAAFSIPTDIRNYSIHTVLTKPVERFEIVLGRFLGFMTLMTLILLVASGLSLVYLLRGVTPEAAEESLKARDPMYGELTFLNTLSEKRGDSVGREWDYRSYITRGAPGKDEDTWQTAVWIFDAVPKRVADRDTVRFEFGFDIYRTTKGKEGKGVNCSFSFETANYDRDALRKYLQEEKDKGKPPTAAEIAEQQGYFEVPAKDVTDYHTQYIDVPAGLFRNALQAGGNHTVKVKVRCTDATQYVGMARYDFYLRLDNPESGSETGAFSWNFLKGAVGLWFRLALVVGIALSLSTYLSGVISMLVTLLLYLGGLCIDFIRSVGANTNIGGGPLESLFRLATRQNMNAPLDKTGTVRIAEGTDVVFREFIKKVANLIPDVERFDLTSYVADGFSIPVSHVLVPNLIYLFGYLLCWFVLAYYMLKWREVAAST
jgi:hypothetical protein